MNKDFINILRDIRGSAAPGQPATDGIWYELTIADKNGNPGIYGDILAKYGVVTESAGTFDQAVAILENLNVEVTTLPAGSNATSALVNGVWQIGLPRGTKGIDGLDGFTPVVAMNYSLGNLNYTVTVDGVQITNTTILNLDTLVDTRVNANVDVQTTLDAKQEVIDAVSDAQAIADGLDANVANKIVELSNHTTAKIAELSNVSETEKLEISAHAETKIAEYDTNAVSKTQSYNNNHSVKLGAYNTNDAIKLAQYNANHIERMESLDEKYATRIIDMLNTNKILGMVDKFAAIVPTQYATFMDTTTGSYIYYLNGAILTEVVDYTVINSTTIQMTTALAYEDIVTQVDSKYLGDYLIFEGAILEERIGQPNGVAGLDETGKIPAVQLPSYVDDVIEVPTKAALPAVGELSKIYVVVADETSGGDTSSYRWAGSAYAMISNSLTAADIKALYESGANKVLTSVNSLQFSGGTGTQGTMSWNADEETVDLVQNGAVLQLGQEVQTHVRNTTASTISSGKVVMVTGTIGASGRITVGLYDGVSEVKYILGVCTEDIAAGDDGKVTHFGKVRGVNTSAWNEGDLLYPTTNGGFTNVAPTSGVRLALAIVITKHATNGTIMVRANGVNENAYEPKNANIQTHIASTSNPHSVTKTQVGLSNVDNTADNVKNVATATKWATARTITLNGDVAGSVSVDGSANVTITTTVQPNSIELGTDTTGNYMANVTAGSGISVSHTQGEGSTATITNSAPNVTTNITTAHSATNVIVNSSDGTDGTINSATQTLAGVMSAADKTKLDGIEAGATGDQTASEILTLLKTVDGSGSGVDADLLDGQEGAYYLNASNINTGTINDSYLPNTITSDITGNASTATKLATARTISLTGDVTGGVSFDGNANVSITTTVADNSHNHVISNVDGLQVALDSKVDKVSKQSLDSNSALRVSGTTVSLYKGDGTFDSITTQDTVYTLPTATSTVKGGIEIFSDTVQTVASNTVSTTAGRTYGIQLNSAGQAVVNVPWSDTNTVYTHPNSEVTAGTYPKVTVNAQGHVTAGASLSASDIPSLDASKITSGTIDPARLPSFVDDVLEFANLAGFPTTGEAGKIYIALDTNKSYRWSGSTYVYITSGAVDSVAGKTGIVTLVKGDVGLGNVDNTSDLNKPISTATQNALNLKVDKVAGKQLSTEDYTTAEKTKLSGLSNYTLPIASTTVLGGVKAGANVTIDANGVISSSGAVTSVAGKTGVVALAKEDVGLGNVDNTSDSSKNVLSATKWTTGRTITIGATGKTVDGSGNVSWSLAEIGAQASGNYQPLDATLTALAGVTTAADKMIYSTGADTFTTTTVSSFARTILDDADAAAVRTTIGAQPLDADLTAIAALAGTMGLLKKTATDTWTLDTNNYVTSSGVTSVTGTAPIVSSGGTTPAISISAATTSAAGSMSAADKTKLDGIAAGAEVNVNSDWNAVSGDAQILNKPVLATVATSGSYADLSNKPTIDSVPTNESANAVSSDGVFDALALKAPLLSPTFTTPNIGVATGTSFNSITALASVVPVVAGTAAVGTSTAVARQDHVHPAQTTITGNAGTATTLQTARTINGVSFNGSANINIEDRLGTPIASAATTTIGTEGLGDYIHITGTTTITSFGTAATAGIRRTLIFDGALTITHNATSLICVGGVSIVTVAGMVIEVVAETTANWRVVSITHPSISATELGYLDGVTSAIQTQMNNTVKLTDDETIAGVKTFSSSPIVPNATTANQAANKNYVDGKYSGFKNYIINGNFGVWQRGTSFTGLTNASYSADRWVVYDNVGDINYNVVRSAEVFTGGYGAVYTWNSGTGVRDVIHFIENVTKFKVGTQVTISFEAYTTSTPYTVGVGIQGARGNWAAATGRVTSNIALTNTKTKYSVTLTVPDWTSLGIDWVHLEDTKLACSFSLPSTTNGKNFIIGNVQLEEGSVATPFEQRPIGLELSLCQRYFYRFNNPDALYRIVSATKMTTIPFPVSMRTAPTIQTYILEVDGVQQAVNSGVNIVQVNNEGVVFIVETFTSFVDVMYFSASAEL